MNKTVVKEVVGWGILLWLIGYVLGFIFFFIMPKALIGWVIMPIGIVITLWVLLKKIKPNTLKHYLSLALVWTLIAIVFDYVFIVLTLKPAGGYYKPDVYLYYSITFLLPLIKHHFDPKKS